MRPQNFQKRPAKNAPYRNSRPNVEPGEFIDNDALWGCQGGAPFKRRQRGDRTGNSGICRETPDRQPAGLFGFLRPGKHGGQPIPYMAFVEILAGRHGLRRNRLRRAETLIDRTGVCHNMLTARSRPQRVVLRRQDQDRTRRAKRSRRSTRSIGSSA